MENHFNAFAVCDNYSHCRVKKLKALMKTGKGFSYTVLMELKSKVQKDKQNTVKREDNISHSWRKRF